MPKRRPPGGARDRGPSQARDNRAYLVRNDAQGKEERRNVHPSREGRDHGLLNHETGPEALQEVAKYKAQLENNPHLKNDFKDYITRFMAYGLDTGYDTVEMIMENPGDPSRRPRAGPPGRRVHARP